MRRLVGSLMLVLVAVPFCQAQPPIAEQKAATVKYVLSLQKENGGFAADAKTSTQATLPATSAALRAIKYFGGKLEHKEACENYVRSCHAPGESGYAATPGGEPDVRNTALGLMAAAELGLKVRNPDGSESRKDYPAICYLAARATSFEEIRLSAAALETVQHVYRPDRWFEAIRQDENFDGTYGKGGNLARDTASAAVTILRLGGKFDGAKRTAVVKAIKEGQRADGGWGKEGEKSSDLETTYRVMRCFYMMKEKPNIAACHSFLAKCRNDEGSYSVQPGLPGNVSATYFAGIVTHWLEGMK
jgi:prenyltransferase beta subunit